MVEKIFLWMILDQYIEKNAQVLENEDIYASKKSSDKTSKSLASCLSKTCAVSIRAMSIKDLRSNAAVLITFYF